MTYLSVYQLGNSLWFVLSFNLSVCVLGYLLCLPYPFFHFYYHVLCICTIFHCLDTSRMSIVFKIVTEINNFNEINLKIRICASQLMNKIANYFIEHINMNGLLC